jgi:hypothetical protein
MCAGKSGLEGLYPLTQSYSGFGLLSSPLQSNEHSLLGLGAFLRAKDVQWVKSKAGTFLKLEEFNLWSAEGVGVYVIWHEGHPGRVVKVGQGEIQERLGCHRRDREITSYNAYGSLLVTWALVPSRELDGIERYLGDSWRPLVGDRFPNAHPIPVNSPFA